MAAVERGGRTDTRQRRAFQKLSDNPFDTFGVIVGSGLVWNPATHTLSLDLATNSGLEFTGAAPADKLRIDLDTNVLTLTAAGLSTPFFSATGNDLTIATSGAGDINLTAAGDVVATGTTYAASAGGAVTFLSTTGEIDFITFAGLIKLDSASDINITNDTGGFANINITASDLLFLQGASTGIRMNGNLGFFNATPIAQPGTYTLTAGTPAASTYALNASGNNGAAFVGLAAGLGGTPYAAVADLNTLRVEMANLAGVVRQALRDIGNNNGVGLIAETGY